ncbi:MAG: UDP-N-acetylmuramate dehydrogenase [Oscillospiraceae bacterium]|nr:UDP-N-acetylmuramate dehydrogenase [Oscillospiraceae bacterium]
MENLELAIREIKEKLPGMTLLENEPMSAHSSFHIGGPARALAVPSDVTGFTRLCAILREHGTAPFLLGNGSNILFPDEGLPDLLLVSTEKLQKIFLLPDGGIYAEAGVSLARLAAFACEQGLTGLEFASGIPGTVGGGLRMNAGAYGGEMKDVVDSVVYYYLPWQELFEIKNENCRFGYRSSIFQQSAGMAILSAVFRPQPGDKAAISARMRELNEKRREKQPLDLPSAGSAFKRPEGHFAAALIDQAGLKGYTVGGAQVSEKHAGFVVNRGGATSKDVYELMMHVRNTVYEQFQVELTPEIIILPPDYKLVDDSPMPHRNRVTQNSEFGIQNS